MIGILIPLLIATTPNTWVQDLRTWKSEENRVSIDEMLDDALMEHDCPEHTEQEE